MEKSTRLAIARMEDTINSILQSTIDAVLAWTSRVLSGQQRTDFRPKLEMETFAMNQPQTSTCNDVCRFLSNFHFQADQSLSASNLNVLLQEVAVQFRSQLLDHFKKWQVSEVGGVVLARDMSRYVDLLKSWKIEDAGFTQGLEILTELASVFVLKPEALRERIRGQG